MQQVIQASKHPFGFSMFNTFSISDALNEIEKVFITFHDKKDVLLSLDSKLIQSDRNDEIFELALGRHKLCPLKTTSIWPEEERVKLRESLSTPTRRFDNIQIAVAVLIENVSTQEVLLTKRGKHL